MSLVLTPQLKRRLGISMVFAITLACVPFCHAQQLGTETASVEETTFKLNATKTLNLPPAMYGLWSIMARVVKSTAPIGIYSPDASEIWDLYKENDQIYLKNVVTNAIANIHVDQVQGDTATFHHSASTDDERMTVIETPTITVLGNKLNGINRQEIRLFRRGKLMAVYHLEVQLQGSRLAGSKVLFKDPDFITPDFEVEPLRFEN